MIHILLVTGIVPGSSGVTAPVVGTHDEQVLHRVASDDQQEQTGEQYQRQSD